MVVPTKKGFFSSLVILLGVATASAQQATLREFPKFGFKIKLPSAFTEMPLEPLERQTLVKFSGKLTSQTKGFKGEHEITVLMFKLDKAKAVTGSKEELEKERERARSVQEQKAAWLNGAATVPEYLQRREFPSDLRLQPDEKPFKTAAGRDVKLFEVTSYDDHSRVCVRIYALEDESELFGMCVLGEGIDAFRDVFKNAMKSLDRGTAEASATKDVGKTAADPYEGSTLRGIPMRKKVRDKLVKGWSAYDTENFILITNVTEKKLVADLLVDLEVLHGAYEKHFPPIAAVDAVSAVRVCATYEEYLHYGAPDGTGGYWNHVDEELVLFDPSKSNVRLRPWLKKVKPLEVLYHEAMHQYFHYSNGQVPPASWFNEGYGEYFGGAVVDRTKKAVRDIKKNEFRMEWIKVMQKQQAWPTLANMLKQTQSEFYGGSALQNYAMGWAFCWFLEQERAKKDGNPKWAAIPEQYIKHLRAAAEDIRKKFPEQAPKDWIASYQDEIQAAAFKKTFTDIDLDELEKAWIAAMKKY